MSSVSSSNLTWFSVSSKCLVSFCLRIVAFLVRSSSYVPGGLIIPSNSLAFAFYLSQALASSAPHLTLEFLKEWSIAFARADMSQKSASLYYVAPWLVNLEIFAKPSREVGVQAVKLVEEVVRTLVSLTVGERRVSDARMGVLSG